MSSEEHIAVLIPCLNESLAIAKVIEDFQKALPQAAIYVIDNNSTDGTDAIARDHGATVLYETRRGKGFAMRTAFRKIDADIYIMVDGDDTYPAEQVGALLQPVLDGKADMTIGSRLMGGTSSEFRPLNRVGNWLYPAVIRFLLRVRLTDILSGYRVMTRELVQTLPMSARDFEIEAELTVKALERSFRLVEIPVNLRSRPEGSFSKIRIVRDGYSILWTIVLLFRDYRPMAFFGGLGILLMFLGLIPGAVVISEFIRTGLVPHFPSAILAAAMELAGMVSIAVGLLLSAVARRFQELESKLDMMASRQQRER
jgi:glycosyltransferase involved in cell wall biosynthesis